MDPERYIAEQALRSSKFFTPINRDALSLSLRDRETFSFLPNTHCGFVCNVYRREPLSCCSKYDPRAVVSLALTDWRLPFFQLYANKVPLMCANVSRLQYTLNAFEYGGYRANGIVAANKDDPVALALNFLIETDIKHVANVTEPNARFSRLLHLMRSSGYEDYVFALARHLELDVDLAHTPKKTTLTSSTQLDGNVVFRYKQIPKTHEMTPLGFNDSYIDSERAFAVLVPSSSTAKARRALDSRDYRPTNGVLTAIEHEAKWFVRVTQNYIIRALDQ